MTLEEYFNQRLYFSESAQEMKVIRHMPFSHAYYAFRKLLNEHGEEFANTPLFEEFMEYLCPSMTTIRDLLAQNGSASCIYSAFNHNPKVHCRSKFYKAAHGLGAKVKTHDNGKWIEGEIVNQSTVRIKGQAVA